MRSFTTTDKPKTPPIEFELDGRKMVFSPPGWAPIMSAAETFEKDALGSLRIVLDWLGAGLSEEDGQYIIHRLQDPDDPFDIDDTVVIMAGIMEEVTGRPILPSSDSLASPEPTPSTDGRPAPTSTLSSSIFGDSATLPTSS